MDSERMMRALNKLSVNVNRPEMFSTMVVLDMLVDLEERWQPLWEELPTDLAFDSLYGGSGHYQAFIYQDVLFERTLVDPDTHRWQDIEPNDAIVDWLLDNTPFDCCVPIADLYRYALGLNEKASPWILFLILTGYIHDEESAGYMLIPIGGNDAISMGRAITNWGEYADVVDPYIRLLLRYSQITREDS